MAQNSVLLTIYFKNLPDKDSQAYESLMKVMKDDGWALKHAIISKPCPASDETYYRLHSDFYQVLSKDDCKYCKEVPVTSIQYDLYEQFSKKYHIDLDIQVSKSGMSVAECLDNTSVNYYNFLRTFITNGHMLSQSFSHLYEDGNLAKASIDFKNNACKHVIKDLYPMLTKKLSELAESGYTNMYDTDSEKTVPIIDTSVQMDASEVSSAALRNDVTTDRTAKIAAELSLAENDSYDFQK